MLPVKDNGCLSARPRVPKILLPVPLPHPLAGPLIPAIVGLAVQFGGCLLLITVQICSLVNVGMSPMLSRFCDLRNFMYCRSALAWASRIAVTQAAE